MRLFNRLIDELRTSDVNKENNAFRGRKEDEGTPRGKADKKRNMSAKKLGLEALEERQLLSVNPIGADYNEIRAAYSDLELPESASQINVIALSDLSAESVQAAINQAAQTKSDDLLVLRTTQDNYVVNLDATAITINLNSDEYGKLTIVGSGDAALTVVTQDTNAFTVLNGDVAFDGMVLYNFSSVDMQGGLVATTDDANVTYGAQFAMVNEVDACAPGKIEDSQYSYNVMTGAGTEYVLNQFDDSEVAASQATVVTTAQANNRRAPTVATDTIVPGTRFAETVNGSYNSVSDVLNATLRRQGDYFGFTPSAYRAVNANRIYDAECVGCAGWVGTMANMLSYTGWAQAAGFSTRMTLPDGSTRTYESVEDAVVDYLRNNFIETGAGTATNYNLTTAEMLDYFFSGNDRSCMGRNLSALTNSVEGGGMFMDVDFAKVGGYVPASSTMLDDMLAALRAGNAVTMEVQTTDSRGNVSREYVSVWGYYYNGSSLTYYGNTTNNSADYYGLICTNPLYGTHSSSVSYQYYGNNEQNGTYNGTYYYDERSNGSGYDTYHNYLLNGANSLTLVTEPYTYINSSGGLVNERTFPEGFQYYSSVANSSSVTYTSTIVGFSWLAQYTKALPAAEMNQNAILSLESMPGNTENVIYLYFGGDEGNGWDGLAHPQFDMDGSNGYGVAELQMIEEIYRRVAEDYAPFNVNVTTNAAVWARASKGIRCVIGGYSPSAGGLSGVGSFGTAKTHNYVYPYDLGLGAKAIAEAASHEVGHSLGLHHDGYEHNEYYTGENSSDWAPIMGAGYYCTMTQWSNGDYVNATNFEDDVAIIASVVGYRTDEHGDTYTTATDLGDFYVDVNLNVYNPNAGTYRVESVIERRTDVDVFSFVSYGGTYVVDVSGDGADDRFIDRDFNCTVRNHSEEENPVFGGLYYADTHDYTNLNVRVSLLDEFGNNVLLDLDGNVLKLGYGEKTHAFLSNNAYDSDYRFYVVDQFGNPVYLDEAKTILKEGYYAIDDSVYTTFSHFVTPELEAGKRYYIAVEGVGQGSSSTSGYSDYGSLGQYTLTLHESYENFYIDDAQMNVTVMSNANGVDNVLNWQEAFVYSGRRLEDGQTFLGNTLRFNESLANTTIDLNSTLTFTYSRGLVNQPWAAKRYVLDATPAWNNEYSIPGITFDAHDRFRTIYVDNTTVEMYGFIITGGNASRGTSTAQVNNGGGVYNNYGWLTIGDSIIAGNRALKAGGGVYNSGGEYEDNAQHDGWLMLINSAVIGNKVTDDGAVGGGVFNESGGVITMSSVTVAGNTADYSGGGIENYGVINAYNSIIAKNYAVFGADVYNELSGTNRVYATIIGNEARNSRLDAYRNGRDSIGDARSLIGTSAGGEVGSPVTVYDPGFVSYRDYASEDWSNELWGFWNLRLTGDSLAVNRGVNANLSTSLDFTNNNVQAYRYANMHETRYFVGASDFPTDLAGQNRIGGSRIDSGAYEVLDNPDLTGFVPTSAGSDVVNNWENSIVVSRAIDDQTGSVAPFLVDEQLYLNMAIINQGPAISTDFETTVYMWKYDAYTPKAAMYASSTKDTGVAIMTVKVEFGPNAAMPGGSGVATITCTNLATGEVQTYQYDGSESYILLENIRLDSAQALVDGMIDQGVMAEQNEEGYFVFGYAIDTNEAVAEYNENNNFFLTTSYFDFVESPVSINDSIVVTTTADVVDPYDGEISLREAVEVYAGSFYYSEIALQDGDVFEANGVTYKVINGKFYVDVTSAYQVYPGEQFTFTKDGSVTATWSAADGAFKDADGNTVVAPVGAMVELGGIEYTFNGTDWVNASGVVYTFSDGQIIKWDVQETVVVTYVVDVFYDEDGNIVDVPEGTVATINDVDVELVDGVWTNTEVTAQYTRDDVQSQGSFVMADGSVVTVVNGVFRREATDDVAIVPDGSVVTLANGETAVYDYAQDRFIVTVVTTYEVNDGDKIVVGDTELTFVSDSYVDSNNVRYYLEEGTVVTLSNGYTVTYDDGKFVYNTEAVSSTKLAAGTTVILNGEEYSYKAGRALVKRVSRESNAVVFATYLDGETFVLTQGPLTLDKTFTLDCVDPDGALLDLTITSSSDDPCLFYIKQGADVSILHFAFEGATSEEDGAILENYGKLTINQVEFTDNDAKLGSLIYNASGATLNVIESTFANNKAENSAIIFNLGSANISAGTTFTGDNGLRSPIYSKGVLTVDETTFTGTSGENGGAIYNDGGIVTVARSTFKNTTGAYRGGAIANIGAADLSVYDSTFNGTSSIDGGAIYNGENSKLTIEAAVFTKSTASGVGGAIYNGGIMEDAGSSYTGNKAQSGAAIYTDGSAQIVGSTFKTNAATSDGGAIYGGENSSVKIIGGTFMSNTANNGAAIYSTGVLDASNSLFAKNKATTYGGAIYAASTTTFVNVTIADNKAADGAGFYNAGNATVDNSILANNTGAATGFDLYTAEGASTTLRNSLLANIAQVGPTAFTTVAEYRSILGVDPQLNSNYGLKKASPAINAGSNSLDTAATDLAGNARRVGLTIGGEVRTVDMGAYEYQTTLAPDLALLAETVDYWGTQVIVGDNTTELNYYISGQDVCINFNVQNVGDARVIDNFKFNVKLVGVDASGNTIYDQTLAAQSFATEFNYHDWLNVSDWIDVNGEKSLMTNFGALPVGYYTVTVTLDIEGVGAIYEYGEEDGYEGDNNNVFVGNFNVYSEPSTVVTTERDVVDATDGLTSLREAVDAAAGYKYVSTFLVADGTTFTLENGEVLTVVDGWLTQSVDVVIKNGEQIDLQEGDEFLLNGRSIYYHYQMNGGYFTYGVDPDSPRVSKEALDKGPITYPDGTSASFELQTDQYIHYVDDSGLNDQEGSHYTYNVLSTPEGDIVLQDGMRFSYSNVNFTYYQNEQYPQGAFVFEDGTIVEYEDGSSLSFASLAIGSLSTRNARVEKAITLADGSLLDVRNGVATLTKEVDATVTFDPAKMKGKTITIDPAKGPIVATGFAKLIGSDDLLVDRELVILGEDNNVTVAGANITNMFVIDATANVTISDLSMKEGYSSVGGALVNYGELHLQNVNFSDNLAFWGKTTEDGEHLRAGLGGAISNRGYLTVDGGTFSNNTATDFGGAVFTDTDASTAIKNATFTGNKAFAGGAIAAQTGALTVENTTFSSNTAERAGAIYTLVDTTVVASVFTGNKAVAADYASRNVVGGAIYASKVANLNFAADPNSESTVAATFTGNEAEAGGAVYAEAGFNVAGDFIATGNKAIASQYVDEVKGDYGAVFANGAVNVTGGLTVTGNEADGSYGGFYANGPLSVGLDANLSNNTAKGGDYGALYAKGLDVRGNATFASNTAAGSYGAAYVKGDATVGGNADFASNQAGAGYGAALIEGALDVEGNLTATANRALDGDVGAIAAASFDVTGDLTATGNSATGDYGAFVSGGAVNVGGSLNASNNTAGGAYGAFTANGDVTVGGNAALDGNYAGGDYGAAYINGAFNVTGDASVSRNTADSVSGVRAQSVAVGGNLTVNTNENATNSGALVSDSGITVGGAATATGNVGGAIIANGDVTVEGDADLQNNSGAQGAAINATGAVLVKGSVTAKNNVAEGAGGAIFAQSFETNGALTATGNQAGSQGGAIYSKSYVKVGEGASNISGNKAGGDGGAIYAIDSVVVAGDATVATNVAGTVATDVTETTTETVGPEGETILTTVKKTTYSALGGAIYIAAGGAEFGGNVLFNKNEAHGSAGALYAADDVKFGGNASFTNNTADGTVVTETTVVTTPADGSEPTTETTSTVEAIGDYGAAVINGDLEVAGVFEASGNKANRNYGAMYVAGNVVVNGVVESTFDADGNEIPYAGYVAKIVGNTAGGGVGAIEASGDVTINGAAEISGNSAAGDYGAIKANSVTVTGDATVANNAAGGEVGAIYAANNVAVGGNATVSGNTAGGDYGAIQAKSVAITGNANIENNKAEGAFGAIYASGDVTVGGNATVANNEAKTGDVGAIAAANIGIAGDAAITGNKAGGSEGAFRASGNVTVGGAANISNNSAAGNFGAGSAADVAITGDATVIGNTAGGSVGAIYAANTFAVGGNAIVNDNTATGAIGAIEAKAIDVTGDATFTGNEAGDLVGAFKTTGDVTVGGNATINKNKAGGDFGAFFIENGNLTVGGDADISENVAGGSYGAGFAKNVAIGGNAVIDSNKATAGSYGAMGVQKLTVTGTASISGNSATDNYGAISATQVEIGGAAIVANNVAGGDYGAIAAETVYIGAEATISGNKATGDVGAIYASGSGAAFEIVGDATIVNNVAGAAAKVTRETTEDVQESIREEDGARIRTTTTTVTTTKTFNGSYGAFFVENGSAKFDANANISNNSASSYGAFYVANELGVAGDLTLDANKASGSETVTVEITTLTEVLNEAGEVVDSSTNVASTTTTNDVTSNYGAGYVGAAVKVGGNAEINGNKADDAYGALEIGGAFTVGGNLTANENAALNGSYGAIKVAGATRVTGDATFDGNTATGSYGALYASKPVTVGGSLALTDNEAGESYGAAYVNGTVTVDKTATITGNKAGGDYGALYVNGSLNVNGNVEVEEGVEVIAATISGNSADGQVGAVYVEGATTVKGSAVVSSNKAGASYGAIFTKGALTVEGNAQITDNSAEGDYGAVYAKSVSVTGDAAITGNSAEGSYGAVYSKGDVTVGGNATVTGNEAGENVGAIFASGAVAVGGDANVSSNKAGGDYGAIKAASFEANSATVKNNVAGGDYGAIAVTNSGVAFSVATNATITGNKAGSVTENVETVESTGENGETIVTTTTTTTVSGKYGAIAAENGAIKIDGDAEISYNTAATAGAIYAKGSVYVGGALTMAENEAIGKVAVKTEVATTVYTYDEEGNVVDSTTTTETTESVAYEGANYGAAYAGSAFTVVGDATVTGNKATGDYGAIYAGGVATFGSLALTGNEAGGSYGAFYGGSKLTVNGAFSATDNKAGASYGAAFVKGAMAVSGSATVSNNTAETVSGVAAKSVAIDGDLIADGNQAANSSGAVVADTTIKVGGDAAVTNNVNGGLNSGTATEITGALTATSNTGVDGAAIYSLGSVKVDGDATLSSNKVTGQGGAIYAKTNVVIGGSATITGNTAVDGGAVFAVGAFTVSGLATVTGNEATNNGGAINAGSVNLNNALIANNKAAEQGGAIYAKTVTLVNVTVASNEAFLGGAIYVYGSAAIDNSILAGNSVTTKEITTEETVGDTTETTTETISGSGVEIFVADGATVKLRNSLIQNVESTGDVAFDASWMEAAYRCFVGVDPQFVDAANGDYSLKMESPAVNAGSNALAKPGVEFDLAGNPRYAGVIVGEVVYSIDMGAFEYQLVYTPDLSFNDDPVNFWFATIDNRQTNHYIAGYDVVLDYAIANIGDVAVYDKFNVTFAIEGVTASGDAYSATTVGRYQDGADYFDWLRNSDWLAPGATQSYARQNLGALPVGTYTLTITLDSGNEVIETSKENNVFTATFEVYEAPSVVVTTVADGEYNPLDDVVTLREASELYVGPYWYSQNVLVSSGEYVRDDMVVVTVEDGVASVGRNVAVVDGADVTLVDGMKFEYGKTYVVFENGVFTYPDGTQVAYAPGRFDSEYSITITLEDGTTLTARRESKFDYLESIGQVPPVSAKYEYVDVLVNADGTKTLLSDLTAESIAFSKTYVTYNDAAAIASTGELVVLSNGAKIAYEGKTGTFLNGGFISDDGKVKVVLDDHAAIEIVGEEVNTPATFVGAVFTLEDGSYAEFVDGGSFTTEAGLTVDLAVRRDAIGSEFTTIDGQKYTFTNDGVAKISKFVGNAITVDDAIAGQTVTLAGTAITLAKDQTIAGSGLVVDPAGQSRAFNVNYGLTADISDLNIVNGREIKGGAIFNAGTLTLDGVNVSSSVAYTNEAVDPTDKILPDGFGGAIYNSGALTVNGGVYSNNESAYFGGAIYSIGALEIDGATFDGNASNYFGGAIYFQNSNASIKTSIFKNNESNYNGGAIAAAATGSASNLSIVNSLLVGNKSANAEGGAVYAVADGSNMTVEFVNDTVADNSAAIGGGVALDGAAATMKNTIVAENEGSYQGADVALEGTSTLVLYASLLGNGEDVMNADALSVAEGSAAFIGTTANPIDPKFGADYALTSVSPAVNSGVNSYADGLATDVYGGDRIVGQYVDMGAVEYFEIAPDLTFGDGAPLTGWYATVDGASMGKFLEGWDVCFDYTFGNYGDGTVFNSFKYTITVERLDAEGQPVEGTAKVFTRTYGDDVDGYMSKEYWLESTNEVSGYWNLGQFDAGQYRATISLDVENTVYESDDENNSFSTTFEVAERPSLVVTTELDAVDEYDGLTSLREAIAAIGNEMVQAVSIALRLEEGASFELAANEELGVPAGAVATYADGKLSFVIPGETVDGETVVEDTVVDLIVGVSYALTNGETLVWNGADEVTLTHSIADTITFDPSVYGKTIVLTDGEFTIDTDMVISVGDSATVTIDAHGDSRIFFVAHGDVRIGGLTLVNAAADEGAAIYNAGELSVNDVVIKSSTAAKGAGVYNAETATVDLWNVSFADMNATEQGAAIYNAGTMVANLAQFSGLTAVDGAAIYNVGSATIGDSVFAGNTASGKAGAIYNDKGTVTVGSTAFDGNSAQYGGAIVNYQGVVLVASSTFVNNTASADAGAIDNYGALTLAGVDFSGNTASGFGGAIYNSASSNTGTYTVTINGANFLGNSAGEKGGAIYNASKSEIVGESGSVKFGGNASGDGAAIYNAGAVRAASEWSFESNAATGAGGAIYNAAGSSAKFAAGVNLMSNSAANGGAVYNGGSFAANNANVKSNRATSAGGAFYEAAKSSLSLSNSLVWLNTAGTNGGAIANLGGTSVLHNVTVAGNTAAVGGGVYNAASFKAYNTIVASNFASTAVDLYTTTTTAYMYNSLLGDKTGVNKNPTMKNSVVGDAGFAVAPVFRNGVVVNTPDLTLQPTSAAVNSGNNSFALDVDGNALVYDLAGEARICTSVDAVDMGAYEFPFEEPSNVVTTNLDVVDPTDRVVSLREAISYAQRLGETTVTFDPSVQSIILVSTLYLDTNVTIGSDNAKVTLETADDFDGSVVVVGSENQAANVGFYNMVVTGGDNGFTAPVADNPDLAGGGIRNFATLTLDKVEVTNNTAAYGGGVYNAGTMTITNSKIEGNTARYYGGVYNRGSLTVDATFIEGNSAVYYGGGIGTYVGMTISNTVVAGNTASLGAGVYAQVNLADLLNGSGDDWDVNIVNSTIVGNKATGANSDSLGAGVWANHILNVNNSIVYGNVAKTAADLYATSLLATSKATLAYSNVGVANVPISGSGVKSVDPKFVDFDINADYTAWDLDLQIGSSMIDAGSNALVVGTTDVTGAARIAGKRVDIGSYEEQGNVAPSGILIDAVDTVLSSDEPGATVATLTAVDGNEGDTFVYELVDDANGAFVIDGNTVKTAKVLSAGDYVVTVKATDSGNASVEKTFTVVVSDPASPNYATPTVVSVGRDVESNIVVEWATDDPAKEYVVEYRVKGTEEWTATSAFTGLSGALAESTFATGDVVEVRIKALTSSVKNESEWSDVAEYTIAEAPASFNVDTTETELPDGRAVVYSVQSNTSAYAYWKIDWNDGQVETITGLTMSRNLSHWYTTAGSFKPVLYVDNAEEGLILGEVTVDLGASGAVVEPTAETVVTENVFSMIEPVAVEAAAAVLDDVAVGAALQAELPTVEWNAIGKSLAVAPAVQAQPTVTAAPVAVEAVAAARSEAFAEFASFDTEADAAVELDVDLETTLFDENFLNDLFED